LEPEEKVIPIGWKSLFFFQPVLSSTSGENAPKTYSIIIIVDFKAKAIGRERAVWEIVRSFQRLTDIREKFLPSEQRGEAGTGTRSGMFGTDCVCANPVHPPPTESPDYEIKLRAANLSMSLIMFRGSTPWFGARLKRAFRAVKCPCGSASCPFH
jgi:hypothetical protein